MLPSHHQACKRKIKKNSSKQTSSQSAGRCRAAGRLSASQGRPQGELGPRGEGACPTAAPQNKRTDSASTGPAPSDEAAGRCAVTVLPRVKAQDFLGGVSLCCSMRSIRAAESCFLCGHKAELLPLPSAADTLWCCQWCNAQLKGDESGFYEHKHCR